ncbi:MAG: ATP-binding protein [Polyangia bacterium]
MAGVDHSLETTRMILYAAARVLGCGSVQLALLDDAKAALVFKTSITNQELARLHKVESELGFPLEGARMPLTVEDSVLVRAYDEGRVIVTHDVGELTGSFIDDALIAVIRQTIGPRTFAVAPIPGGPGVLGVLVVEKPDESGLSVEDRELLVAYADRVGADLESAAISADVERLASFADTRASAPVIYTLKEDLTVIAGPGPGLPLWEVLDLDETSLVVLRDRLAAEGQVTIEVDRAGDDAPLRITLSPGPRDLLIAAVEDRRAETELRREMQRSREHLGKVLASLSDAILTLDADHRIVSASEAVERILGYHPTEVLGMDALDLVADARSRATAEKLTRLVLASGFAECEVAMKHKGGDAIASAVSSLFLADDEGRPAGAIWRVHDLTERRRSETERKKLRARLLETERLSALGEMAARIAHEVRNPLVSIGAAAQVVAEEVGDESPVIGELRAIAREVRRLDNIVTDFLRFARPRRYERRPADLSSVIDETLALVRGKGTAHDLQVSSERPLMARCDPDAIKQVLLNVLLNAVEASPTGTVQLDASRFGDLVVLAVADRGPGVPESARRRVFDPFFSTKARGTGLGLAVSKQIIDEHKGRIRLLRRRGGGTRVVIELPA